MLHIVLLAIAVALFLLASGNVATGRLNLTALGLAAFAAGVAAGGA